MTYFLCNSVLLNPFFQYTGIEAELGTDQDGAQPDAVRVQVATAVAVYNVTTPFGGGGAAAEALDGIRKVPEES